MSLKDLVVKHSAAEKRRIARVKRFAEDADWLYLALPVTLVTDRTFRILCRATRDAAHKYLSGKAIK